MADIAQVRSEVNSACSRYVDDKEKMEQAANAMSMYQKQANQAERDMNSVQREISSVENEIYSLQSEINNSSEEDGGGSSYAVQHLNLLYQKQQALSMKTDQLRNVYMQAQANYSQVQSQYTQAENDLNTVRNYLEQVRTKMMQAADVFQTKIDGFNKSLQILGSASGNMFASSANSQIRHLQPSRNQYQENLDIAQNVIVQISSTIDDQGSARVLSLNRSGRSTGDTSLVLKEK